MKREVGGRVEELALKHTHSMRIYLKREVGGRVEELALKLEVRLLRLPSAYA